MKIDAPCTPVFLQKVHTMKNMIVHILVKYQPFKYNSLNPSKKIIFTKLTDMCMLTNRTGMFVVFANRSKAEVHSFTCFTPITCHKPWNQHLFSP
jgi:hypothetical protein